MKTLLSFFLIFSIAACNNSDVQTTGGVQTQEISYSSSGTQLKGFLAWDDSVKGKRPGVLVVHEWWGHNEHARDRARMLAELGYTALALDMCSHSTGMPSEWSRVPHLPGPTRR